MSLETRIKQRLEEEGIEYGIVEHEPVYTNPAMAEALGVHESETVKSLVVKTREGDLAVVVLPGDARMEWKKAASAAGSKKVSFAKPEIVSEKVGCEVGCVPPFGHNTSLPVIMQSDITAKSHVYFNPGVHDKSYRIASRDLVKLCDPVFMDGSA
jgi:Ala-tRNA(Pro) deacylase